MIIGISLYLIVPVLIVHRLQFFSWDLNAVPMERRRKLPSPVKDYLDTSRAILEELGFTPLGPLVLPKTTPNAAAIIEMFVNRSRGDSAMVSCVYGLTDGAITESVRYVEFIRRFRDGEVKMVQTNNNGRPGAFPDNAKELTFRFPTIKKIEQLYALHREIVDRDATGARPCLRIDEEFGGDQVRYLETIFREAFQRQTDRGWLYFDDAGQRWWLTIRGAIRLTWQELFPFKQLRTMRLHARGRRQLAQLQHRDEF